MAKYLFPFEKLEVHQHRAERMAHRV